MSATLRICLLAGCAGLGLLEAPEAGLLLTQGVAGPYAGPSERAPCEVRPLAGSTESLGALRDAGDLRFPVEEPWRKGLPRGL